MKTGRASDHHYLNLFLRLWPRGAFHDAIRAPGRAVHALLYGSAKEAERMHNRVLDALNEIDPRTATETLGTWEGMTGLPDLLSGLDIPSDPDTRQAQVHAKLTSVGGNNPDRYIKLAAKIGADVWIYAPFRFAACVDMARCGDLLEEEDSAFIWQVEGACPADRRSRLENLFLVYTPSHIVCAYVYA